MRLPHYVYTLLISSQESAGISTSESGSELSPNRRLSAIRPPPCRPRGDPPLPGSRRRFQAGRPSPILRPEGLMSPPAPWEGSLVTASLWRSGRKIQEPLRYLSQRRKDFVWQTNRQTQEFPWLHLQLVKTSFSRSSRRQAGGARAASTAVSHLLSPWNSLH